MEHGNDAGDSGSAQTSSDSGGNPSTDDRTTTAKSDGERPRPDTKTLGVLLVHGIGSQRRGDTLVHCATALHKWLRKWLAPDYFGRNLSIDLVDTNVAESGPDRPAQARIIFRRGNEVSKYSWLLAESCWFETYRRPTFYEFARWALRVLPVAVVLHFVPAYRNAFTAFDASIKALKTGRLTEEDFAAIKRALGPAASGKTIGECAQSEFLRSVNNQMMARFLGIQLKLALAAPLGLLVQLLLLAVAILAVIPGFTRSFAGWVQLKLSATLGDSYLFVTSPITGAAIATRVKKDLEWLSARCDRVIVVGHSQGAAVSYQVIEREFWVVHVPEKLHALVTYGSGLRKLFDLEQAERELGLWTLFGVYATVVSALMAGLIVLLLSHIVPWWVALPGLALGVVLQMFPMLGPKFVVDPAVLRVRWHDHYASHDPVPNGPIAVSTQESSPDGTLESEILGGMDEVFVEAFKSLQREVVNRRSTMGDHTSYWSSQEDFVAGLAGILAEASDIPMSLTMDDEWLKVSKERRRWRVTWLSRCRAVAGLMAVSVLLWPRNILEPVGGHARELATVAVARLPAKLARWVMDLSVPEWIIGAAGLMLATYLMFLLASAGWGIWERKELARFFRRSPHPSIGFGGRVFAVGWVGVLTAAPVLAWTDAHFRSWGGVFVVAWAPVMLAAWSIWTVVRSEPGPGAPREWGRRILARAEAFLADNKLDRAEALRSARFCFRLTQEQSVGDEWGLGVLGETRVIEEMAVSDASVRAQATAVYQDAIKALERSGRDASEVKKRLLAV